MPNCAPPALSTTHRWNRLRRHFADGERDPLLLQFKEAIASVLEPYAGKKQMRHSDPSTTLGHYGHVMRNDHREAMESIESVFFEPNGSRFGSSEE